VGNGCIVVHGLAAVRGKRIVHISTAPVVAMTGVSSGALQGVFEQGVAGPLHGLGGLYVVLFQR